MKLLYLAGPYRSKGGEYGVQQNIEAASNVARILWGMGYAILCPHKNTAFFGGTDIDDQVWLDGDLEMLSRCDGIVMMPDWKKSVGATVEHEFAYTHGLDMYYWPDSYQSLLRDVRGENILEAIT